MNFRMIVMALCISSSFLCGMQRDPLDISDIAGQPTDHLIRNVRLRINQLGNTVRPDDLNFVANQLDPIVSRTTGIKDKRLLREYVRGLRNSADVEARQDRQSVVKELFEGNE